jgi:hypothetical protein
MQPLYMGLDVSKGFADFMIIDHRFNTLLYTAFPELLTYCQDGVPDWVLKLSVRYPAAVKLKNTRVKSVAKVPRITIQLAQKLIAQAKDLVASTTDPVTQQLIKDTVRQILR